MLSVTSVFDVGTSELTITSDAGDNISVDSSGGNVRINGTAISPTLSSSSVVSLVVVGGPQANNIYLKNVTSSVFTSLTSITVNAGGGADQITASTIATLIHGGDGNDTIIGADGNDTLYGDDGNDTLVGMEGSDTLDGGAGVDYLYGGGWAVSLSGDAGDSLIGGSGNDFLYGMEGADSLDGGDDDDQLYGGSYAALSGDSGDNLNGEAGDDTLLGMEGSDTLDGGAGADWLYGGAWAISLSGDAGDSLIGGSGNDSLYGMEGADSLDGGDDDDQLYGGSYAALSGDAGDSLNGGAGNDTLLGMEGADSLTGGSGDDLLLGGDWSASLTGDAADTIYGGDGQDTISGSVGNDVLYGDAAGDVINGDSGNDSIHGGDGADIVDGGDGNDTLYGDNGADTILGKDGVDYLYGSSTTEVVVGGRGVDYLNDVEFNYAPVLDFSFSLTVEDYERDFDPEEGLLTFASDPDGDDLAAALVSGPRNGSVTVDSNGSFTYSPNADFVGMDAFVYSVTDGYSTSYQRCFMVVVAENDAPVASDDPYSIGEGLTLSIDPVQGLLHNDHDVDGDATPEMVVANMGGNLVNVLLDVGQSDYPSVEGPFAVAMGDLNNDGNRDFVVLSLTTGQLTNYLGAGDGTFFDIPDPVGSAILAVDLSLADVTGDGYLDVITTEFTGVVSVRAGVGDGTFGEETTYSVGFGATTVAVDDFDADGKMDIAAACTTAGIVSILWGQGSGAFGGRTDVTVSGGVDALASGRMNADGRVDLVVTQHSADTVTVLSATSSRSTWNATSFDAGGSADWMTIGDLNDDGHLDVVVSNGTEKEIAVLLGNGAGGLGTPTTYTTGSNSTLTLTLGDLDDDGDLDLVGAIPDGGVIRVWTNDGTGTLTSPTDIAVGDGPTSVDIGDVDNQPLTAEIVDQPEHGQVWLNDDGSFLYRPDDGFYGTDAFTYRLNDGQTTGNTATVSLTVNPIGPGIAVNLVDDTGVSTDRITSNPSIIATIDRLSLSTTVSVRLKEAASDDWTSVSLDGSDQFSLSEEDIEDLLGTVLVDGAYTLQVKAVNSVGTRIADFRFVLDRTGLAPTLGLDPMYDSQPVGDRETYFETVALVGTAEAFATVVIQQNGNELSTVTADAEGRFRIEGVTLSSSSSGVNTFIVSQTDAAGNESDDFTTTIKRISPPASGTRLLTETSGEFESHDSDVVTLPVLGGKRTIRVDFDAVFSGSSSSPLKDQFLVYVVDPSTDETLLDRGTDGTAVFSTDGVNVEFAQGIVRYDGAGIEIDVSSLESNVTSVKLIYQLLNADSDATSIVRVQTPVVSSDPDSSATPMTPVAMPVVDPGDEVAGIGSWTTASGVQVLIDNVRYDSSTHVLTADVRLKNGSTAALGRNVAVLWNSLPTGVKVTNASGDSSGVPYTNFRNAIAAGGLAVGMTSQRVQVVWTNVTDPFDDVQFLLTPAILAGAANQAPTLPVISDQTVEVGQTVTIELVATDADEDPISYSLRSLDGSAPLPNVKLSGGEVTIAPKPGQSGTYEFDVVASDGVLSTTRRVHLTVPTPELGTTRIRGRVLDVDGTPLDDVPIEFAGASTVTGWDSEKGLESDPDAHGWFTLEIPPDKLPTASISIQIPVGDPSFDPFNVGTIQIPFRRTIFDPTTGTSTTNPLAQINTVSTWIDASMIYGSDEERATALRTGAGGRLKVLSTEDFGDLLPQNNAATFGTPLENDNQRLDGPDTLFVAGDVRAPENTALSVLHTVFLREHNRLADEYAAAHPTWTDEEIYQHARKMVTALVQRITYDEFLPALIGSGVIPAYTGYNDAEDPTVSKLFSTAAFRVGHTMLSDVFNFVDDTGTVIPANSLDMLTSFFNSTPILENGIEPYLCGMLTQEANEIDNQIIDGVRNMLFGPPGAGGMDLASMNIQRGREQGLPTYNAARAMFGLDPAETFDDITSNSALADALEAVYGDVDKVDLWVGGISEDHVSGASVGALFQKIIADQFQRLRDADRFWYENMQFDQDDLDEIRATTLADVIYRNTGVDLDGDSAFFTDGAHAPDSGAYDGDNPTPSSESRSYDGSGNNETTDSLGQAGTNLSNEGIVYGDGISTPNGADRPNPRAISQAALDQSASPGNARHLSMLAVFWGQLIDHDVSLTPAGISSTTPIKFFGNEIDGPDDYPFVAEPANVLLEHDVYTGVDNEIVRPIYLPKLDSDMTIEEIPDPENPAVNLGTLITNDQITITFTDGPTPVNAHASVFVPDGALADPNQLTITRVPPELTPAALPPGLNPAMVVSIQPAGQDFSAPVLLTLPNTDIYAPGMMLDLYSINPRTGVFEVVGKGKVSDDGHYINTVEGGIRSSSWHFFSGFWPVVLDLFKPLANNDCGCGCSMPEPAKQQANSTVDLYTGELKETHQLVSYESAGQDHAITLVYDSLRANPTQVIRFGFQDMPPLDQVIRSSLPEADPLVFEVRASLTRGDDVFSFTGGGERGKFFWIPPAGGTMIGALSLGMEDARTGVYDLDLSGGIRQKWIEEIHNGDETIRVERWAGSMSAVPPEHFAVVNEKDNPFGAGWGIAGLQSIYENPNGALLLVDGDGTYLIFDNYTAEGDFSLLQKVDDGEGQYHYSRTMRDGEQNIFYRDDNGVFRLTSRVDHDGNTTSFEYDSPGGGISAIVDPAGLRTSFEYSGSLVSKIIDPFGRITELGHQNGDVTSIRNPDGAERQWGYSSDHLMTSEIDARGFVESEQYGLAGRLVGSSGPDGTSIQVRPVIMTGLYPPGYNSYKPLGSLVIVKGRDAAFTDQIGNTTTFKLDKGGQVLSATDNVGSLGNVERNSDNLIVSSTDGRGNVTRYSYTAFGQLKTVSDAFTQNTAVLTNSWFFDSGSGKDSPSLLATGDFNRDGIVDIVAAQVDADNHAQLAFYSSDGKGSFIRTNTFGELTDSPNGYRSLVVGDVDGNGTLDVVASASMEGEEYGLFVYFGDGAGGIDLTTSIEVSEGAKQLGLIDVNRDGKQDILFAGESLTLFIATGASDFLPGAEINGTDDVTSFAIGKVNSDAYQDLVVSKSDSAHRVQLLFGTASGQFGAPIDIQANIAADRVLLGDLDADKRLDLVVTSAADNAIEVLFGGGDRYFSTPFDIALDEATDGAMLTDTDSDGDLDIAIQQTGANQIVLLENTGRGAFADPDVHMVGASPSAVVAVDSNADGRLDLVAASSVEHRLSVLMQDQTGSFLALGQAATGSNPVAIATGDLDGDGDLDLVTANHDDDTITIALQLSNGKFEQRATYSTLAAPNVVKIADLDGDGWNEIIVGNTDSTTGLSIFARLPNGSFERSDVSVRLTGETSGVAGVYGMDVGDIDGDGDVDFVVGTNKDVRSIVNEGGGNFGVAIVYGDIYLGSTLIGGNREDLCLSDFNSDGILDLVFATGLVATWGFGDGVGGFDIDPYDTSKSYWVFATIDSMCPLRDPHLLSSARSRQAMSC